LCRCIAFLSDRYSHEKTLFKTTPSLTDVRNLQQCLQDANPSSFHSYLRDEFNPHVIAGVVVNILKCMPNPLFGEVYQDLACIELTDDYNHLRSSIAIILTNLSASNLELVCMLLTLKLL